MRWNVVFLTAPRRKFQLGWKTIIDPPSLFAPSIFAGIDEARNSHPEWARGRRAMPSGFWALIRQRGQSAVHRGMVVHSIFHLQDPRYFYMGTGSICSRALYAKELALSLNKTRGKAFRLFRLAWGCC